MDVEKTMQFLLEQQAVFASRMDELAVNLVAIGKAQTRYDQQQARIQQLQIGHEERILRLEQSHSDVNRALEALTKRLDRLTDLVERGFSSNGGRLQ